MHSRTEKIDLNDLSKSMEKLDFSHMDLSEKSFIGEDLELPHFEGPAPFSGSPANLRGGKLKKEDCMEQFFLR